MDSVGSGALNCSAFSINAPSTLSLQNSGALSFTINNGTNKKADIYLEGSVEIVPSIISLPSKTAISRDAIVNISATSGEVIFRPVIEGCSLPTKRVSITNTGVGALNQVIITSSQSRDANTGVITLSIEVNNPTTKVFYGTLEIQSPAGWSVQTSRSVSVTPGKNVFQAFVTPGANPTEGKGKITFKSNGEEITTEYSTTGESAFAGLFAFGGNIGGLGAILLIILVVLVLVAIIAEGNTPLYPYQAWTNKR